MRKLVGESALMPLVVLLGIGLGGCGVPRSGASGEGRPLRVATNWPQVERTRLEDEFQDWLSQRGIENAVGPAQLFWIAVSCPPRPGPPATSLPRADVLLGGPLPEYVRLARLGTLATGDDPIKGSLPCLVVQRQSVILSGGLPAPGESVALDDPRVDAAMLTWCTGRLKSGSWNEGYAGLIRLAGRCSRPVGWLPGTAQAALGRGEVGHAIGTVAGPPGERPPEEAASALPEGAAILATTGEGPLAAAFLRFLRERRGAAPLPEAEAPDPDIGDLLADLLGSALVDSQDEVLAAWSVLGGVEAAAPSAALSWMTEPPPWPPASVEKLLVRGGDRGLALAHDLAGQLAVDPELRFWLIQSWLRPTRPIDLAVLGELARAGGGRLVREPRFRSWLRSEWTAWARQRYRRVARLATAAVPAATQAAAP
jgi:hypothetical protein